MQGEKESLKDFMARFNTATLEITDLNEVVAMSAFKKGLKQSRFTYSLDKTFPKIYSELLARASKYIRADEGAASRRETEGKKETRRGQEKPIRPPAGKGPNQPRFDATRRPVAPRFHNYAPLTAPRANVLMEIEGEGYLPKPTRLRGPLAKRNMKKYCRYHRDYGHDTEECYQLKDEIEALIRRGHLRRYVRGPVPRSEVAIPEQVATGAEHDNQPTAGVIHMISTGLGSKGTPPPSPKRVKTVNDVITFSESDLQGVQTPHDDAVVVSSTIAKYDVKRILVDNGSSTNVLFYAIFSRVDLSKY